MPRTYKVHIKQLPSWVPQGQAPPPPTLPLLSRRAAALATNSWVAEHTFTEGRGSRVEALLEGGGGVDLDGWATLGAAHQGKVDAGVH